MIDDPDIFRAAVLLIGEHGKGALLRAQRRASELGDGGTNLGSTIWHQIAVAVEELQRAPGEDEAAN